MTRNTTHSPIPQASRAPAAAANPCPRPGAGSRRAIVRAATAAAALALGASLAGCQSAYYSAMEKIGYEKRDILSSRVESARDAQQQAKEEVVDALTAFSETVNFKGGELEARYKSLAGHLTDSETAAQNVRDRIDAVGQVGDALFREWGEELEQYRSATLKARSREQMLTTRRRYDRMIAAMRQAEARLEPALGTLRDQVLFLKHNLNARALSSLQGEVARVDAQVNRLVKDLNAAIEEANGFIETLEAPPAAARDS